MNLPSNDDERQLFEYFIVAGLNDDAEELTPVGHELANKPASTLAPITDIMVIFPTRGETAPKDFHCLMSTPSGSDANLNNGALRAAPAFLCYRRGFDKAPLGDIGIMDESKKERAMEDSTVLAFSPKGLKANICNTSEAMYFTYRRCKKNAPPHELVVMDIAVIITSKGETPPHTYYKLNKNLNKGIVGSDVYVCYKKAQPSCRRIAYKPMVLDCFPKPIGEQQALTQNVAMFCLPMGALIECWSEKCELPKPDFSTCVLTDALGKKFYGASLTFYETYTKELSGHQKDQLGLNDDVSQQSDEGAPAAVDAAESIDSEDNGKQLLFVNKSICIVSFHPFFNNFRQFLNHLYYMSNSNIQHDVPIERYISHLMMEVPFPTPSKPRILVQLSNEMIAFENYDNSQFPLSGASFVDVLKALGVDNFLYIASLVLLEQKILLHSLRPWMLSIVSETLCAIMFPFHWQCPYIPQCPLPLADVLHAPMSFIAGVDSHYFDLFEDPPPDVTCLDIDTSTIRKSNQRCFSKTVLPKSPTKKLRADLLRITKRISDDETHLEKLRREKLADAVVEGHSQHHHRLSIYETQLREAFLKFMCSIMTGYVQYLRPIVKAPHQSNVTDIASRFDVGGFVRSREEYPSDFYTRFVETQYFNRFIEERSFFSDKIVYNAYFDDCVTKLLLSKNGDCQLIYDDSLSVNKTVVMSPPQLLDPKGTNQKFVYENGFPRSFTEEYFEIDEIKRVLANKVFDPTPLTPIPGALRYTCFRTKQEIRHTNEIANQRMEEFRPFLALIILNQSYNLWFLQLPSLLSLTRSKLKFLRFSIWLLAHMRHRKIPHFDQVCFRTVIQMCKEYGYPYLAFDVLKEMNYASYVPNAVTYAIYHWAVMSCTHVQLTASAAWHRLKLRLLTSCKFRHREEGGVFFCLKRDTVCFKSKASSDEEAKSYCSVGTEDFTERNSTKSTSEDSRVFPQAIDEYDEDERILATESVLIKHFPLLPGANDNDGLAANDEDPLNASVYEDSEQNSSTATMSPSREKFLRDHSGLPFHSDSNFVNSQRKSSKTGSGSWLKKLTSSPVVSTLMRSHTSDDMRSLNDSVDSLSLDQSNMANSPSLSFLFGQVRKQAMKGYGVVSQHGNTLFKKSGVNTLVNEVRNFNKSYSRDNLNLSTSDAASSSFLDTFEYEECVFDTFSRDGINGRSIDYCMTDLMADVFSDNSDLTVLDITLCSCTMCPHCLNPIYDEDLIAGFSLDDNNFNTKCPGCEKYFAPRLKIRTEERTSFVRTSFYSAFISEPPEFPITSTDTADCFSFSVPFVSSLVLRREIETLLAGDIQAIANASLRDSHPIIFWNLVYYQRRLDLPSHIYLWLGRNVHIRCIYDLPSHHTLSKLPLYLANHLDDTREPFSHLSREHNETNQRTTKLQNTISYLKSSNLMIIMQLFVNDWRVRNAVTGQIQISPHFSLYRDILFTGLDYYRNNLDRNQFDSNYRRDHQVFFGKKHLSEFDGPPSPVSILCRRIFLALDMY